MTTLRVANDADAAALAALAEKTFRDAFGSANSAEDMALHCRNSYGTPIQAAEIANPAMLTLLGEVDGALVGYAQLRRDRAHHAIAASAQVEIQRLYVAGEWHGRGVAQRLMVACIDHAMQQQAEAVWLGVWEHNPRAIAFYRKHGFVEVGEQPFTLGSDLQRDLVMVRHLGERAGDG